MAYASSKVFHLLSSSSSSSSSSVSISPQKTQSHSGYCPKSTISFSSSIRSSPTNTFCKRSKRPSPLVASAGVRHLTGYLTRTEGLRFAVGLEEVRVKGLSWRGRWYHHFPGI